MTSVNIRGINVNFPFEPYEIQKVYMEKVIECLQTERDGVLESPTGTGKTLSLLCSSLAWLTTKKAEIQAHRMIMTFPKEDPSLMNNINDDIENMLKNFTNMPTIIYASRTHSQLAQAIQELKESSYNYVKSTVIGSRDQMCLHPEVSKEDNHSTKVQLCRMKIKENGCHYYHRVESMKLLVHEKPILDIEDLVTLGKKNRFCPYYMSKEIKQQADILFMPYNYILDPRTRRALGIQLANNVILLDEAHNVDKMCEDGASIEIKSSDITLCIDEVTNVMKILSEENSFYEEVPINFTADELCVLKELLLKFEKALDNIPMDTSNEVISFDGSYIYKILEDADIMDATAVQIIGLTGKLVEYYSTQYGSGVFTRKGHGLQLFEDFLRIVFASTSTTFKENVKRCYKVCITEKEVRKRNSTVNIWIGNETSKMKILNFWCFSSGFGMNLLKEQGARCIILTSGTLAPLKPLIAELQLDIKIALENPHIIGPDQICVRVLKQGPDCVELSSAYKNRDNENYMRSLGSSILNIARMIPNGLLIFFPSYPILQKCQDSWQQRGIWSSLAQFKPIFVEPKEKEAFQTAMTDYYAKVRDPQYKGAIFIGVCRGKISEGLDFVDHNGRAVIIIGLPFPPLKDPKIILKRRYVDECRAVDKNYFSGSDWYTLEAARAVNQAIGRVIRHRYDYGAIILLDVRFANKNIQTQLSSWVRNHIKVIQNFGEIIRDLKVFFKNSAEKYDEMSNKLIKLETSQIEPTLPLNLQPPQKNLFKYSNSFPSSSKPAYVEPPKVEIHRRKRIKLKETEEPANSQSSCSVAKPDVTEIVLMMKSKLTSNEFQIFIEAVQKYRDNSNLNDLKAGLDNIFLSKPRDRYLIQTLAPYIKSVHQKDFQLYCDLMR